MMMSSSTSETKKGSWSPDEDSKLVASISFHGVGRWNSLAQFAGLQRSGKSCRLRWLNYLRPNVRHGGFTLEEQLLILQLHFRWGNRWARIAEELPGRTDNDIKNYWRTRVMKHAKRLNCDVNSPIFKHTVNNIWIPGLADRVKFESGSSKAVDSAASASLGLIEAQKYGDMNVDGPELGPAGIEPSPSVLGDDPSSDRMLSDEDVFYLQHLLFNAENSDN